ncbi:MAG: 50S ribosomal protein L5 [Patescibacteria group bacterium]|nr:50S ribosomal protein L5 [Patescibacteria group bacterium]
MRLKEKYQKEIAPSLKEKFSYKNTILVPRLQKVVINIGFGKHAKEKEAISAIESALTKISGQKPILTKAKKSISAFKVREGMVIGAVATLRGERMYDFVEKLVNISFPRVRDFRGISDKGVDRNGNMTIGLKDYSCFPELKAEDIDQIYGLEICLNTNAKNREEGLALFQAFGFPFKKNEK